MDPERVQADPGGEGRKRQIMDVTPFTPSVDGIILHKNCPQITRMNTNRNCQSPLFIRGHPWASAKG